MTPAVLAAPLPAGDAPTALSALRWAIARDVRIAIRSKGELAVQLTFYVVVVALFPLATTPERAMLAATARPLWILDEPATALDACASAWLGELVTAHAGAGGIVVAATHQPLPLSTRRVATLTLG